MRVVLSIGALALFGLAAGFFMFVAALPREEGFDLRAAAAAVEGYGRQDVGIVIFTGGGGARIERALRLYEEGVADRVLISGTHPKVTKADLGRTGNPAVLDCCVDLGIRARTTIGNAIEARDWAADNGYRAVYLVTSDFHLPRSVAELRHAAPALAVAGVPVSSRLTPAQRWLGSWEAWRVLAMEYAKFLTTTVRSLG